ncbi:MAG: SpvB/TcaC N-terminal domain-containing protein [Nitrospirota bacterium]
MIRRHSSVFIWPLAVSYVLLASFAASAKEVDDDTPIKAVGGAVHADLFTGATTTSIPIEVPPGRNGMQPNLQLVYSSANGNGWVGMGWKLEVGAIERQTRFGVNYSGDDYTFHLNGVSTELVATPQYGTDEYRAKIEGGFTRIRKLSSGGWEATDKKGTKYLFGQTGASRITNSDGSLIFKWCLDWVVDRDGNYMKVVYWGDQGNNQGYLDEVRYTGHTSDGLESGSDVAPTNVIKFYRDAGDRLDAPDMYTSNFKIKTRYRLKTIAVWADLAMTKLVRAYKVQYSQGSSTGNSMVSAVQQFGSNASLNTSGTITNEGVASALPAATVQYTASPGTFDVTPWTWTSGGNWSTNYEAIIPGDFNGDGKADIYIHGRDGAQVPDYMGLSTGTGFSLWTWGVRWDLVKFRSNPW